MPDSSLKRRQFIGALAGAPLSVNSGQNVISPKQSLNANQTPAEKSDAIKLTFCGTGAADWPSEYPLPGESIDTASFRGNASLMVDSSLMIDCGPTVPEALVYHKIDTSGLSDLFITHSHGDHFNIDAIQRLKEMTHVKSRIKLWHHSGALERFSIPDIFDIKPLEVMDSVETSGIRITALPANHVVSNSAETPLHFLLEKGLRRILYATDGAWLLKKTWLFLKDKPLDAVIWDATIGEIEGDWRIFEHNSLDMVRLMTKTLSEQNVLKQGAQVILTHMAYTLWPPHDEIAPSLISENITPAWDGMEVVI